MKRELNDSVGYSTLKAFQQRLAQLLGNKNHMNWTRYDFLLPFAPTFEDGKSI